LTMLVVGSAVVSVGPTGATYTSDGAVVTIGGLIVSG
jgi:hypothetical protein